MYKMRRGIRKTGEKQPGKDGLRKMRFHGSGTQTFSIFRKRGKRFRLSRAEKLPGGGLP